MNYKGLSIGEFCSNKFASVDNIEFLSDVSLFDYDLLFCDLNQLEDHYPQPGYRGTVNEEELKSFYHYFEKRKIEIEQYTANNKKIIFFMPYPKTYYDRIGYADNKIAKTNSLLPFNLDSEKKTGVKIEVVPNTIFTEFFKKYFDYFYYSATSKSALGHALCLIENTNIVVSSIVNENIILFPDIRTSIDDEIEIQLIKDIIDVLFPEKLTNKKELPGWTKKYILPHEQEKIEQIKVLNEQRNAIEKEIVLNTNSYNEIINNKILFSGTGKDLENQVENIFKELGFVIHETESNRDDLILEYNSKIAVVEIKGVKGSSAEKQAAQLNKWVANYHASYEIEPKGILLINAYKDEELINRKFGDVFPNQMLNYCNRMNFCLLTTTQLLGLFFEIKNNPEKKEELIDSLFSCIGVYEKHQDWNTFIEISNG